MKHLKSKQLQKGYKYLETETWGRSFSHPINSLALLLAPFSGFEPVGNIVFKKNNPFFSCILPFFKTVTLKVYVMPQHQQIPIQLRLSVISKQPFNGNHKSRVIQSNLHLLMPSCLPLEGIHSSDTLCFRVLLHWGCKSSSALKKNLQAIFLTWWARSVRQ